MSRDEYIAWYQNYYRHPPKQSILDKYFPKDPLEEIKEATPEDWEKFWKGE